jgi:hypothetical protein
MGNMNWRDWARRQGCTGLARQSSKSISKFPPTGDRVYGEPAFASETGVS